MYLLLIINHLLSRTYLYHQNPVFILLEITEFYKKVTGYSIKSSSTKYSKNPILQSCESFKSLYLFSGPLNTYCKRK